MDQNTRIEAVIIIVYRAQLKFFLWNKCEIVLVHVISRMAIFTSKPQLENLNCKFCQINKAAKIKNSHVIIAR